jgi:hypothetical protein
MIQLSAADLARGATHQLGIQEDRPVADARALKGAIRVDFSRMDYKEADWRGEKAAAPIAEVALAGLYETKLIFLVPVSRHRSVHAETASKLKLAEITGSPDLYHIASLIRFHLLLSVHRSRS